MKKFILAISVIFFTLNALAQLEVKSGSFKETSGFVNTNPDPNYQTDDNDLPFAVIKVRTENISDKQRRELRFEGNGGTFIMLEYKTGEVWVYLTAKYADYLKISHPDFSTYEFTLPEDLKPKHGYELTLVNKSVLADIPVKEQFNYLTVKADQPNAMIYFDGQYVGDGEAAQRFKVGETHQWSIECELYHSENGKETIVKGNTMTIEKKLRPAFGYLNITSTPENGATVFIDNKRVGETPFKTDKIASGEHKIRVVKEMYKSIEQTFTVTDGKTTDAKMTMTANFVSVMVTTDSQSDIYIDNEKKGTGCWNGRLSDGEHVLEAKKASHKASVKNVTLVLGNNENIVIPNPTPIYGTLDINSSPMGATIYIDGKSRGITPKILDDVLIGKHELKLEKADYITIAKTITLDETKKLDVNEKLENKNNVSNTSVSSNTANSSYTEAEFSVGHNKKVIFSKGNLQYQASTNTWRFAEHQWDFVGTQQKPHWDWEKTGGTVEGSDNINASSTYSGWIDLFGWGTSGYNGKDPYMTSGNGADYGDGKKDITSTNYDWGVYNTISNGEGKSWRTLTRKEWLYVLKQRKTNSGIRYAKATVNNISGVILLPDNWDANNYSLINSNKNVVSYDSNIISLKNWIEKFESKGAIFLPGAGWRMGSYVYSIGSCWYWSTTYYSSKSAYQLGFEYMTEGLLVANNNRDSGSSVRLVRDLE